MAIFQGDETYVIHLSPRKDGRWAVDAFFRGYRATTRASSTFSVEADAVEACRLLWRNYRAGILEAPVPAPQTLGQLVQRFLDRPATKRGRDLSPKTKRAYASHLQSLVKVAGENCPIHHLSAGHIRAAVQRPTSKASAASYLRSSRAMVRWAISQRWLDLDVTADVTVDPGPQVVRPFLQPEEVDAFLVRCPPAHRIRAALILETGMRAGEAVHMRWEWIVRGIGRPAIRIPAADSSSGWLAKGRRIRNIPLSSRAQEALDEAAERWGAKGFVLHGHPTPIRTDNWHADTVIACKRAEVTKIDTHGLRRTAGVLWLAAGLSIFEVSRLLGHGSVVTTERAYAGIADQAWTSVMDRVDARAELPQVAAWRKKR